MIGLGIESSCDETSIGIVENGNRLKSLKLFSQISLHSEYRGVVPELASRAHLEKINILFKEAIEEAKIDLKEIDFISVSNRPGLLGSLMIGCQMAKVLSLTLKKPVISVDHLESHLSVVQLENNLPPYPFLGVLLSGGNSAIFQVNAPGEMEVLGDTLDDALGEAFDKVSSLLNLPYPGGPYIEKKAAEHSPEPEEKSPFPEILKDGNKIQFSYSGLKTSVLNYIQKNSDFMEKLPFISYHFQNTAFKLVEKNVKRAVKKTGIKKVVAAGGVLANGTLRNHLKKLASKHKFEIIYPEKKILCTDNGAMVACLGFEFFKKGIFSNLNFKISPNRENFNEN
ncbi:MAG: tRNA (adenosine(37)-N6)-threonylcarbamoyltransferase complex transferase subunit TsaD [Leptospiraceae bacterium]|nr:tRNA (adenosine(37)-N6)-threonylcarbamoyltransferase complex transferase subunit TsaD [Leptospiraceae bacterium]